MDLMKRNLLSLMAVLPVLSACTGTRGAGFGNRLPDAYGDDEATRRRFKGVSVGEFVLDALVVKEGVTVYNEKGQIIGARGTLRPYGASKSAYPGGESGVPKTIRATWRIGKFEQKAGDRGWVGGTIVGDYTIPVAERIPDEVLSYLRQNGGALRLKLRLYDEGLLVGWDVPVPFKGKREPDRYYPTEYTLVGGDFQEAYIFNGKVVRKGWYIGKTGQKVFTDY